MTLLRTECGLIKIIDVTVRIPAWATRAGESAARTKPYVTSKRIEKLGPILDFVLQDGDAHAGQTCVDCGDPCGVGDQVVSSDSVLPHAAHVVDSQA